MNSRTWQNFPPLQVICRLSSKLQISQSLKFLKSKQSQPPRIEGFFIQRERFAQAFIKFLAGCAFKAPFATGPSCAADVVVLSEVAVLPEVPLVVASVAAGVRLGMSSLVQTLLGFCGGAAIGFAEVSEAGLSDCCAKAFVIEKERMSPSHAKRSVFVLVRTTLHLPRR